MEELFSGWTVTACLATVVMNDTVFAVIFYVTIIFSWNRKTMYKLSYQISKKKMVFQNSIISEIAS